MGRISNHNYYQDVLNGIALDIRTKSRRSLQRRRELEAVRLTLGNLHEKAKYLEQQRKLHRAGHGHAAEQEGVSGFQPRFRRDESKLIEGLYSKRKFLLPFTERYDHQQELECSGRVPKFGSYKYSVWVLVEKGVVVS